MSDILIIGGIAAVALALLAGLATAWWVQWGNPWEGN